MNSSVQKTSSCQNHRSGCRRWTPSVRSSDLHFGFFLWQKEDELNGLGVGGTLGVLGSNIPAPPASSIGCRSCQTWTQFQAVLKISWLCILGLWLTLWRRSKSVPGSSFSWPAHWSIEGFSTSCPSPRTPRCSNPTLGEYCVFQSGKIASNVE